MTEAERQEILFREAAVKQNTYYPIKANVEQHGEQMDKYLFQVERENYLREKEKKERADNIAFEAKKLDDSTKKYKDELRSTLFGLKYNFERQYEQYKNPDLKDFTKAAYDFAIKYVNDFYYPKEDSESYLDRAIAELEAKERRKAKEFNERYNDLFNK